MVNDNSRVSQNTHIYWSQTSCLTVTDVNTMARGLSSVHPGQVRGISGIYVYLSSSLTRLSQKQHGNEGLQPGYRNTVMNQQFISKVNFHPLSHGY